MIKNIIQDPKIWKGFYNSDQSHTQYTILQKMRGINPLTMVPDVNPITLVEADTYDLLKFNQIFDLLQPFGRFHVFGHVS